MPENLTLHRLTMNAIWVELKLNRWRGPTSYRDLNDYGDNPDFKSVASGTVPKARAMNAVIRQTDEQVLIGTIPPDERLGTTTPTHVVLTRAAYATILASTSTAAREDIAHALHYRAGDPYALHVNGRGEWTLQKRWDAWLTPHVHHFLSRLAERATEPACQTTPDHAQHALAQSLQML